MSSVQAVFGTQRDVGKAFRVLLSNRIAGEGNVVLESEGDTEDQPKRPDNNPTGGAISDSDVILVGDIVVFGRDERKRMGERGVRDSVVAIGEPNWREQHRSCVDYRLIDTGTSDVIASGEVRGKSKSRSVNSLAIASRFVESNGGTVVDMASPNLGKTPIGEAIIDCVDKLAAVLRKQVEKLNAVSDDLSQPRPLRRVRAEYSGAARKFRVRGTVGHQVNRWYRRRGEGHYRHKKRRLWAR